MSDEQVTYIGQTDFRNRRTKFGIKKKDRSRHVYIIGKTGMGKSTVLENMAAQDILNGEGMCFVDPHGSAIDTLIEYIPEHRVKDVIYFAPFDTDFPITFNVMENVDPDSRHLVVNGLMASFKKIWQDAWSARMEYILSNTLLALLEYPRATLLGVNRMLAEKDYRNDVIKHITDESVKAFWIDEYNKWDPRYAREAGAAIQNKIGQFTANPLIRNIIGQEKSSFDIRELMDNRKIFLVNLSKGRIGEQNANLLGGMIITKIYLAAMSRAEVGSHNLSKLPDFFFFVDEFQNFANESFADILSEARKYKLSLTVAHQYVDQMQEEVASAIFGNVGTMITFRVGPTDAEVLEKQFAPVFTAEDIVNLGRFQIYLTLMIDGIGSRPFSATTLPPVETQEVSMRDVVIANSRKNYAQPRSIVEEQIKKWFEPVNQPVKRRISDIPDQSSTPSQKISSNTRQTFIAQKPRDFDSPIKRQVKEEEEREAEIEMKKVVSPRLNQLLEKISQDDSKDDTKAAIPQVVKNIQKHEESIGQKPVPKKTVDSNNKQQPAIQKTRGTQQETKSSLQSVLQKALGGEIPKKQPEKQTQKTHDVKPPVPPKKPDVKEIVSLPKTLNPAPLIQEVSKTPKEIPEDVLRRILE